jgi:hypothetical protein
MAPVDTDDENEDFTTPHLPERYHQQVKAKKQRRLKKHIMMAAAALLIIAVVCLALYWALGGIVSGIPALQLPRIPVQPNTDHPVTGTTPFPVNTTNTTDTFTRGPGLSSPLPSGILPLDTVVRALRQDYPEADYTILSADLTDTGSHSIYTFRIEPVNPVRGTKMLVTLDAVSGLPYSTGEEQATISRAAAQRIAMEKFSTLHPGHALLSYSSMHDGGWQWVVTLFRDSTTIGTVTIDATTGDITSFAKTISGDNRHQTPMIDMDRAQGIADSYINDHNGGLLPLNRTISRYDPLVTSSGPVAGQYMFLFERTFQDYPTDVDGFTVSVDAISGDVIGYSHQWTTPEHAFSATTSTEPEVIRREATFAVMQKAKETYPADVGGLRIISAGLRWKNLLPYGTTPRPGSIPLAWKVVFDDDLIRANTTAQPAVAWVDAQSGKFISFDYRH